MAFKVLTDGRRDYDKGVMEIQGWVLELGGDKELKTKMADSIERCKAYELKEEQARKIKREI